MDTRQYTAEQPLSAEAYFRIHAAALEASDKAGATILTATAEICKEIQKQIAFFVEWHQALADTHDLCCYPSDDFLDAAPPHDQIIVRQRIALLPKPVTGTVTWTEAIERGYPHLLASAERTLVHSS